jgi:CheY-like chemotaxis protein
MPGMTGIELARLIKERWPSINVLLTSGYAEGEEGVDEFEFIHKPFRASDLASKLQSMLAAAQGRRQLDAVA